MTQDRTYFPKGLDNFGVILKGASVRHLPKVAGFFDHCFIVNNMDKNTKIFKSLLFDRFIGGLSFLYGSKNTEYSLIKENLSGKSIAHFVNRLRTAPLTKKHYKELGIKNIQFSMSTPDDQLKRMEKFYNRFGLETHYLPTRLLCYNEYFRGMKIRDRYYLDPEDPGPTKHPNTGLLAIIYAAEILKPRTLWLVGLDLFFGDGPYLFKRPWAADSYKDRVDDLDLLGHFSYILQSNRDVQFNVVTQSTNLPTEPNINVINAEMCDDGY